MIGLLYALGIGIALSVGVALGAWLCAVATHKGREQFSKSMLEYNNRVEDRLAKYVEHTERIAVAAEAFLKPKE